MRGTITLPGDKSISHRIAMLAAIAAGPCRLRNFNTGADCNSTLHCMRDLGAEVEREAEVRILPRPLRPPKTDLDCGNSGSTIRMLTGLLAGLNIPAVLTGDASLLRRPMRRVADPLRRMGAVIDLRDDQFAPVRLNQGVDRAITYEMPVSSAQVKSAVLLAGLRFSGTTVIEHPPSRDHTERLFSWLDIRPGPECRIRAFEYDVPGDASSAAFFVVGALLQPASDLTIENLLVNPHRTGFLRVLQRCGARIEVRNERIRCQEPVADVRVRSGGRLSRLVIEPGEVPSLLDELPALSILGAHCGFEVRGAAELRHKESDRIGVMVENLQALGISAHEFSDGYRIEPGSLQPGMARTRGDHRIAMAFAAAGIEVDDPACVSISFPEFFEILRSVV